VLIVALVEQHTKVVVLDLRLMDTRVIVTCKKVVQGKLALIVEIVELVMEHAVLDMLLTDTLASAMFCNTIVLI
jgi:hypothetical protein